MTWCELQGYNCLQGIRPGISYAPDPASFIDAKKLLRLTGLNNLASSLGQHAVRSLVGLRSPRGKSMMGWRQPPSPAACVELERPCRHRQGPLTSFDVNGRIHALVVEICRNGH